MGSAKPHAGCTMDNCSRFLFGPTVRSIVDDAGDFRAIDALAFAFQFKLDLVGRHLADDTFDIIKTLAVFLEHYDAIAHGIQSADFVPLVGQRSVQLLKSNRGNLRRW